jgi:hypothetical protein
MSDQFAHPESESPLWKQAFWSLGRLWKRAASYRLEP